MSFTYAAPALNGYLDVNKASTGPSWPMNSGIFICSLPPDSAKAYSTSSVPQHGMLLQYGQTKQVSHVNDSIATVYHGRTYPTVEHGKYHFLTVQCTYRIPSQNIQIPLSKAFGGTSQYKPGLGFDGSLAWMTMAHILNAQQAIQQPPPAPPVAPCVTQIQDIWGRRTYQVTGVPGGMIGVIYNLQIEDLVDPGGWQQLSFTFSEIDLGLT